MSDTPETVASPQTQEMPFQAEVQQLLHLVVHSLYTNREVFLRELIANASDALDKARFLAITDRDAADRMGSPEIVVTVDRADRTIVIEDNGIGMTRDEIVTNLGTIAHSGTLEFLHRAGQSGKASDVGSLIGQFGVGFYSAFTIADRIDVESRSLTDPQAEAVLWRSSGKGSFSVSPSDRQKPGTRVIVHVTQDADEYLDDWHIEALIKRYSDFVHHPIKLAEKVVNQTAALWTRPRNDVTDEQYDEFFRHLQGVSAGETPLARMHFSADAPIQYHSLLFVPGKAPFDLMLEGKKKGIRLYARRVFVMDGCEKLAPPYLQFLRGVVDSEDLSLNVSREMLQDDRTLESIQKAIVKQTLKTLEDLAEKEPDKYKTFWAEFGRLFRLGISSDRPNQDTIAKLLRYPTSSTAEDELVSLKTYFDRMKDGQKAIYYLTGPSLPALRSSPHLEAFKSKGVEVLLMADPVDEWVVGSLEKFMGYALESVAHGTIDLESVAAPPKPEGADDKPQEQPSSPQLEACLTALRTVLGDRVKDVRVSSRLTESPSCLVSDDGDMSPHMERVMRMLDREVQAPKRILEINAAHTVVKSLVSLVETNADSDEVRTFSEVLLDQALLAEGVVPDPAGLLKRMQRVLTLASESLRK